VAAAAVSVPFRLGPVRRRISGRLFLPRLPRRASCATCWPIVVNKQRFSAHQGWMPSMPMSALGLTEGIDSFWDFDEGVTAPLHGFASASGLFRRQQSFFFWARFRCRR